MTRLFCLVRGGFCLVLKRVDPLKDVLDYVFIIGIVTGGVFGVRLLEEAGDVLLDSLLGFNILEFRQELK